MAQQGLLLACQGRLRLLLQKGLLHCQCLEAVRKEEQDRVLVLLGQGRGQEQRGRREHKGEWGRATRSQKWS